MLLRASLAACAVTLGALSGSRGAQGLHDPWAREPAVQCMTNAQARQAAEHPEYRVPGEPSVQNHGAALGCPLETLVLVGGGHAGAPRNHVVPLNQPATRRAQVQQRTQCCYNVPPPPGNPAG